jgi:hypothetical protein
LNAPKSLLAIEAVKTRATTGCHPSIGLVNPFTSVAVY